MRYKTSVQSANHMMDVGKDGGEGDEPTFVMGASIVMEWIRAIEECLRCELPDRKKKKDIPLLQFNNKLSSCFPTTFQ